MNWEQKLAALQALTDASLKMRKPGDWYVSTPGCYLAGDGFLTGEYGNGNTPEKAVEDHWESLVTTLPASKYIAVTKGTERRHFRWNGFMWEELSQK